MDRRVLRKCPINNITQRLRSTCRFLQRTMTAPMQQQILLQHTTSTLGTPCTPRLLTRYTYRFHAAHSSATTTATSESTKRMQTKTVKKIIIDDNERTKQQASSRQSSSASSISSAHMDIRDVALAMLKHGVNTEEPNLSHNIKPTPSTMLEPSMAMTPRTPGQPSMGLRDEKNTENASTAPSPSLPSSLAILPTWIREVLQRSHHLHDHSRHRNDDREEKAGGEPQPENSLRQLTFQLQPYESSGREVLAFLLTPFLLRGRQGGHGKTTTNGPPHARHHQQGRGEGVNDPADTPALLHVHPAIANISRFFHNTLIPRVMKEHDGTPYNLLLAQGIGGNSGVHSERQRQRLFESVDRHVSMMMWGGSKADTRQLTAGSATSPPVFLASIGYIYCHSDIEEGGGLGAAIKFIAQCVALCEQQEQQSSPSVAQK